MSLVGGGVGGEVAMRNGWKVVEDSRMKIGFSFEVLWVFLIAGEGVKV